MKEEFKRIEIDEIDYHNCHESIKRTLKKGNHILCIVYNTFIDDSIEINVVGYIPNVSHPYVTRNGCFQFAVKEKENQLVSTQIINQSN